MPKQQQGEGLLYILVRAKDVNSGYNNWFNDASYRMVQYNMAELVQEEEIKNSMATSKKTKNCELCTWV